MSRKQSATREVDVWRDPTQHTVGGDITSLVGISGATMGLSVAYFNRDPNDDDYISVDGLKNPDGRATRFTPGPNGR